MSLPEYHRRYTPIDGVFEVWSEGIKVGVIARFQPATTRAPRWKFATDDAATEWETGRYDIGFKSIGSAVEALFAIKRGADGKPPERNDNEPRPNISVAGRRAVPQRDNSPQRRRPKASTKGVGRKNRGRASR